MTTAFRVVSIGLTIYARLLAQTQRPTEAKPVPPVNTAASGSSTQTQTPEPKEGWGYDPDAGIYYQQGDFKFTTWGYGEHVFRPIGNGFWRRVRQGMEFDLPRFTPGYRTAFFYEIDATDTNFFRAPSAKWKVFENLFVSIQDAKNPGKFRVLFGENTHILSREDNLSSSNLPTINRSLILEEHGSVQSFGTQFGVQMQKVLSPRYSLSLSAQDNRGSLNRDTSHYVVGNDVAAKITGLLINDDKRGRKLAVGLGADHTRDFRNTVFTLSSAIAQDALENGIPAAGNKLTVENDVVWTDKLGKHTYSLEEEHLYSHFSQTGTSIGGGYGMVQYSAFDTRSAGDFVPFARYDWVRLSQGAVTGTVLQQDFRAGFNWNLPYSHKLVNFHVEYARNALGGPAPFVSKPQAFNELGLELRFNVTRYTRF